MPEPVRTAEGDLVIPVALFGASNAAQPLQGGDMPGRPIRTADGALVVRVAVYEVEGGVAVPVTQLGSGGGTDLTVDPPLQITGTGNLSIDTDVPGGVPTLDGAGKLSADELPPAEFHSTFDAPDQATMLAEPAEAPSICIRTDFDPPHLLFLSADPASDINNWHDLGAAISAGANPTGQLGTTAVNGVANTFMRSDGAPALDQAMSPVWTGSHDFTGGSIAVPTPATPTQAASKGYVDTADATKVAKAGDTMAGPLLIDQNVAGIKARLAMKLPGTQNDAPTTLGVLATYAGIGGGEWGANSFRLIGFGYIAAAGNEYPAVIGYQETSTSSNTRGDLVLATRPNNNNVPPTIVLRINSAGQILAEAGAAYVPGSVGALTNKKYVDDAVAAVGGAPAWGQILGTLANQADLTTALAAKANQSALAAKADQSALVAHEAETGAGEHLPAGGNTGQIPVRSTGTTVAWEDPPSAPVQSVNAKTGAVTLDAADVAAVPAAEKAAANGVATLGPDGKVPAGQLNVVGGFNYLGGWDASTNTPTLANGVGTAADMYKVSVAGSQDLGAGIQAYAVGDHLVYVAGTLNRWELFLASEDVASVAGKTGVVTLVKADVGLANVDNTADANKPISAATQTALDAKASQAALTAHTGNTANPHGVTKSQVGLANADNTSDAAKPVSTAVAAALAAKADQTALSSHEGATGAGTHLPAGGTSGQVPVKGAGNAVAWADLPAGGGAPAGNPGQLQYNNGGVFGGADSVEVLPPALLGAAGLMLNGQGGFPGIVMSTDGGQTGWMIDQVFDDFCVERVSGGNPTGNFAIQATDAGDHAGALALNADTVTVNGADIRAANALFTTGTVPPARLGTGIPTAGTVLRGDGTWAAPPPAAAAWGAVTGDISTQGDLQQELNGRVLLTSKATETVARAGTDDAAWMSALNVAQAISEHQQTVPQTMSAHATTVATTNDPTTGVEVLFGPTPSASAFEAWQIDWVVYVSADASGRVEFLIPSQTGITIVTSGIGPAVGGTGGAAASVDAAALIFQADTATRLARLTTFINSSPTTHNPIQLMMRSPDSVNLSAAVGCHVVAHKLMIAT